MMYHLTINQSIVQLFRSCDYNILKELMDIATLCLVGIGSML